MLAQLYSMPVPAELMLAQLSSILVPAELMLTYAVDRTWTSNNSQDWWCHFQLWCQNLCGTFSPEKPSPARKHIVCQVQCNYYVVPRFNWRTPRHWQCLGSPNFTLAGCLGKGGGGIMHGGPLTPEQLQTFCTYAHTMWWVNIESLRSADPNYFSPLIWYAMPP